MSQPPDVLELGLPPGEMPPAHGFRGEDAPVIRGSVPRGLSIAVSRESGARGGSIARRVGRKLGWQVYDHEVLEFMAQDSVARQELIDSLPEACGAWAEERLAWLCKEHNLQTDPALVNMSRLVLSLAAQGEVVLIGRGAGSILPPHTTLNVRIVAPLQDRIAYMCQWLRLPVSEAAEKVRQSDQRRTEFLSAHFHCSATALHQYDLVLNSSRLGEEACADLIVQAAKVRAEVPVEMGDWTET